MLSFQAFVIKTQKEIKEVDSATLFENPQSFSLIIDVREKDELCDGMVSGAITIPRGVLESQLVNLLKAENNYCAERPIALYCRSGARSALAAKSLIAMGLDNVVSLKGGVLAWQDNGYPLVNEH